MAGYKRITARQLAGKTIDVHTHVGIAACCYLGGSFPYCQDVPSLLYRMDANGVDVAAAFPMWESLFFDTREFLTARRRVPARPRVTPAPYAAENRLLCEEVYEKVPGAVGRILPFACVDPARMVARQVRELARLADEYPIYGLKVSGVMIQSSHRHLLGRGSDLLHFARERNIPVLLHTTAYAGDRFCHNSINMEIVRAKPQVRFCLAHCLGFDKVDLDEADALPNVWVDSAAMKIQVEVPEVLLPPPPRRFQSDYSNFRRMFGDLVRAYPRTMLWGSDSPAYTYCEKRKYSDGSVVQFALQGTYEQERQALDSLARPRRLDVANRNTCRFLFGPHKV